MHFATSVAGLYKNFTGTTTITTPTGGAKRITGIFVAASSSGILKVDDGTIAVVGQFTGVAGTFYPIPAEIHGDLVITLVSGTINATIFWN